MLNVKMSEKPCVFCGSKEETVAAKSKEQDFQGVVCLKHMHALMKKWEASHATAKSATGS